MDNCFKTREELLEEIEALKLENRCLRGEYEPDINESEKNENLGNLLFDGGTDTSQIEPDTSLLRQKAEEWLKKIKIKSVWENSKTETLKIVHELEVHKIELEMQNQELTVAKLKAQEAVQKYTELYDFAPTGYFTLSKEGDIIELNICGSQMLGKERSRLILSRFGFFVTDDTKPIFNLFLKKIFTGRANETCEVCLSSDDDFPMDVYLTGIIDENGEKCHITAVDITERKQAEDALKESEIKYRGLVDNSPDAIVIYTEGKIVFANNECIRLTMAESDEELIGKQVIDFVHPDYREFVRERMNKMAGHPVALPFAEEKFIRLDGSEVDVEVKAMPIRLDDRLAVQLIIRDITERKQAEEEIKKANLELEKLNSVKDKFFAIIAHDLKSPFQGLLGLTELMADGTNAFTRDELDKMGVLLHDNVQNLVTMLKNLLEWAMMQQDKLSFDPKDIVLSEIVSRNIELLVKAGEQKGVKIIFESSGDYIVHADEPMLNSILINLISNALKFSNHGGKVTVKAKELENKMVEISVKDNGIGMPEDISEKLFKIDGQVGRKGTDGELSNGLGLLLCSEFVEKHGGTIYANSCENEGSTFYFTLPMN